MNHIKKVNQFFEKKGYDDSDYQKDKKKVYNQINTVVGKLKDSTDLSGEDIAKIVQSMIKDKETRDEFWKK